MTNLTLQLDPEALREATVQAMVGVLSPEVRAQLVEKAIVAILTPSTNSWDRGRTPLELAFGMAVTQVATTVAREHVEGNAELMERLRVLVREASEKAVGITAEDLVPKMADAFVAAIRRD